MTSQKYKLKSITTVLSVIYEVQMLKIFIIVFVGLSCTFMMSCSAKISANYSSDLLESHIVDNQDGTFTDKLNRLQWTKDDSTPGPGSCYGGSEKNFWSMKWHVDCLNRNRYLGYNDWRTPKYEELESLLAIPEIKNGDILNPQVHERLKNHAYWSMADLALFIYTQGIMIYNVFGPVYVYHRPSAYYVWPVRSEKKLNMVASYGRK